jgi:hypothetical protein
MMKSDTARGRRPNDDDSGAFVGGHDLIPRYGMPPLFASPL